MSVIDEAIKLRNLIERMAENLDDETAEQNPNVFPKWDVDIEYKIDYKVRYNDVVYKVLQDHTSQSDWTPDTAVSLYVRVHQQDPGDEWPEWVQPTGAHDAYPLGAKVSHNDKHWVSLVNANVWEPSEKAPGLWELQSEPDPEPEPEIEEWFQPTGAGDAYNTGDKVTYQGKHYESLIDGNVWSPADYPQGWELIEDEEEEENEVIE